MDLLVDEASRPVELGDAGGEPPPEAEMPGLPGDLVAVPETPSGDPGHGSFSRACGGRDVSLDIPCQVEARLDGCGDERFDGDSGHGHGLAGDVTRLARLIFADLAVAGSSTGRARPVAHERLRNTRGGHSPSIQ